MASDKGQRFTTGSSEGQGSLSVVIFVVDRLRVMAVEPLYKLQVSTSSSQHQYVITIEIDVMNISPLADHPLGLHPITRLCCQTQRSIALTVWYGRVGASQQFGWLNRANRPACAAIKTETVVFMQAAHAQVCACRLRQSGISLNCGTH